MNPDESLVDAELVSSAGWLIRLRWLAGVGALLVGIALRPVFGLQASSGAIIAIGTIILAYNVIFFLVHLRLQANNALPHAYYQLTLWQVVLDWVAITLLIYFSGGIESPAIFFFIFHIVIASIFFSRRMAFILTLMAIALTAIIGLLEYLSVIPHQAVIGFLNTPQYQNPFYVSAVLIFFGITSLFSAYLVTTITAQLRQRESQVVALTQDLRQATARLQALNEAALALSSTLDLDEVLNRLVKSITEVMEVRGCSIRLVDEAGKRLEPVATYGLSQEYIAKGPIDLDSNPLAREVLSGRVVNIPEVSQSQLLQYPEWAKQEGIHSMLSAALSGKNKPLGILRAYSEDVDHFTPDDETFLVAIAAQGSIAIENAMAYEAIEQLDQIKSSFIRTATHELRSPVSVTRSLLRTITAGFVGELNPQQLDILERAGRRIDFLRKLVDDLLDLAEGKTKNITQDTVEAVQLDEIILKVFNRFTVPAEEKSISLIWENMTGDGKILVMADEDGLDRVFNNLISNAVKYTLPGGAVTVTLEHDDSEAKIVVADTGIGIPEDSIPHLFEEFYRAPNAKEIEQEGTGLGLTIVQDIVKRVGGNINVESQRGKGTRFTVQFPVMQIPEVIA